MFGDYQGILKDHNFSGHKHICWFFLVIDRNVFEMTEKLSHFGQNFWKYRPRNTVAASFNTTVRQMTKMFQQKLLKCFSEKNSIIYCNISPEIMHKLYCVKVISL